MNSVRIQISNLIPKGLRNKDEGCEERATLGAGLAHDVNPERVVTSHPWERRHACRAPKRPELTFFAALVAVFNAPILAGSCWRSVIFQPSAVMRGEWWRVLTHPFVHVTWYHLLLDATAFFSLYAGLLEPGRWRRLSYVIGAAAGSLLLSWISMAGANQTLCGLSGIAHGLMAVSALEMVRVTKDRASARLAWFCFAIVIIKAGFEAITGRMLFDFLNFGLLGCPVAISHAGGVLGALAVMLLFTLLSQKRSNTPF